MESQSSFNLYADKPALGMDQLLTYSDPIRKSGPPPRKAKKGENLFVHYALVNCHKYPPPRRRVRPEPQQVDETKFIQSSILPYPEHPFICKLTRLPAYETEKEMAKYYEHHGMHPVTLLKWRCRLCKMIHAWTVGSSMFDTNGGSCAGAETPPSRILSEFMHPGNEKLFRFVRP